MVQLVCCKHIAIYVLRNVMQVNCYSGLHIAEIMVKKHIHLATISKKNGD